jgi:hypothetical protein
MSDAGKDSQFTLKQAGDYTRHSLGSKRQRPGDLLDRCDLE